MTLKDVAIFMSGKHTDMNGNEKEWTNRDLDKIIERYNPALHEAPVVIGHPATNAPAFGWVESLKRVGNILYADFKNTTKEFIDMLKEGRFKKRSASFYPDMTLRHVGFLGATPPAVKGLPEFSFGENEATIIEFEEFQNQKNISITGGNEIMTPEEMQAKIAEHQNSSRDFAERNKILETENQELKKRLEAMEIKNRKSEHANFCEKIIAEGKLSPAKKAEIMDFMEILSGAASYNFSEGGAAAPLDKFKGFLENMPKVVEFGETATKQNSGATTSTTTENSLQTPRGVSVDPESQELHNRATEYAEKHNVSYNIAINKVIKK
ncbi:MAG: hypothetical protein QMC67_05455 [Candidatus Wallbacteria bacterium]